MCKYLLLVITPTAASKGVITPTAVGRVINSNSGEIKRILININIYIYIYNSLFFIKKKAAVNWAAFLSNKEDFTENLNL